MASADTNERSRRSLQAFMDARGLNPTSFGRMSKVGESVIRKFAEGVTKSMTDKTWNKLALGAGVDPEVLRNFDAEQDNAAKQESAPKMDQLVMPAKIEGDLPSLAPVYALERSSRDMKKQVMGRTPPEGKPPPQSLATVQGVFGVRVPDSTMEDKAEPDDIAWIHPTRPPKVGRYCVFLGLEGSDGTPVLIRQLIGISDTKWRVRQLNPRHEYDIARSEWPRACQIKSIESP